jgi:hypothetical protein
MPSKMENVNLWDRKRVARNWVLEFGCLFSVGTFEFERRAWRSRATWEIVQGGAALRPPGRGFGARGAELDFSV